MATEVARQFFRCLGVRYRELLFYAWRSSPPRPKAEPWGTDPQGSVLAVADANAGPLGRRPDQATREPGLRGDLPGREAGESPAVSPRIAPLLQGRGELPDDGDQALVSEVRVLEEPELTAGDPHVEAIRCLANLPRQDAEPLGEAMGVSTRQAIVDHQGSNLSLDVAHRTPTWDSPEEACLGAYIHFLTMLPM